MVQLFFHYALPPTNKSHSTLQISSTYQVTIIIAHFNYLILLALSKYFHACHAFAINYNDFHIKLKTPFHEILGMDGSGIAFLINTLKSVISVNLLCLFKRHTQTEYTILIIIFICFFILINTQGPAGLDGMKGVRT